MNRKVTIFFALISFLTIFYVDTWRNGNTVSRLLPVKAVVENGTWQIDAWHEQTIDKALINDHYYSEKAPLPAFIVIPFYALLYHTGITDVFHTDDALFFTASVLIAVIPFIIICMLIFLSLLAKKVNIYRAMLTTLLLCFSTFIFIYAGTAFSHILAGLFLLLGYIYITQKENYFAAGLFSGLAFLTEYPTGIVLALWPIILLLNKGRIMHVLQFYNGVLPAMLFQLLYNYYFTGNPFDMLYNHVAGYIYINEKHSLLGFALPSPKAMYELLFGFYRGWLFHAPVLLLFFAMMLKQTIKTPIRMLAGYLLPLALLTFIVFSSHQVWYGGWCFGPRHFVPVTVLLLYHFSGYMTSKKHILIPFYILSIAGILYTWIAKSTLLYSINAEYRNPLTQLLIPAFQMKNFNSSNLLSMMTGLSAQTAAYAWLACFIIAIALLFYLQDNSLSKS